MSEEKYDQTFFMGRVDKERARLNFRNKEVAAAVGLDGNAYSEWKSGKRRLTLDQVQGICKKVEIFPAWALYDEGPKNAAEAKALGGMRAFIAKNVSESEPQTSAEVIVDHDVIAPARLTAITPAAPKVIPPGFVKPEKNARTNRRSDYRIVPIAKKGEKGAVGIPCFESVAAGFGEDLERSEDLVHIRSLPYWKNVHSLVVRGDSMEETLHPRDLILIETLNNGDGITLEGLQQGEPKTPYRQIQRSIPDDEIYVLSIDNEPPTVKRVLYDVSKENDWYLIISADNNTYKPRVLSRQTPIRFYGRLIAIGQKDGAPVYSDRKSQQFPDRIEKKLKR